MRYNFLKSLMIGLTVISMIACSKDDDSSFEASDMVGSWTLQSLEYTGTTSTEYNSETFVTDFVGSARDISAQVTLKDDGTYISKGSYTVDLTYEILGQTFMFPQTIDNFLGLGTYKVDDDQLTIINNQGTKTEAKIESLDGNDLVISYENTVVNMDNGATSTTTFSGTYTFTR